MINKEHISIVRMDRKALKAIRTAVADYISSEGCGCCQGGDHDQHKEKLGKLLRVKKYADKSGYDFSKYKSKHP